MPSLLDLLLGLQSQIADAAASLQSSIDQSVAAAVAPLQAEIDSLKIQLEAALNPPPAPPSFSQEQLDAAVRAGIEGFKAQIKAVVDADVSQLEALLAPSA